MLKSLVRSLRYIPLLALAALPFAIGCSHKIDSPKVTLDSANPAVVCSDLTQGGTMGTVVTINGSGFTPMPYGVLETAKVEIPSLSFNQQKDLTGAAATAGKFEFSGMPGGTNADLLKWDSEKEMKATFNTSFTPQMLTPGVYDVTVTQPDDHTKATLEGGFVVVPPPQVDSVVPAAQCDPDADQKITVTGKNFVQIGATMPDVVLKGGMMPFSKAADSVSNCTDITAGTTVVKVCTTLTATIPGGAVPPGDYELYVNNHTPTCESSSHKPFKVYPQAPILFFSDPEVVYNGISTLITLYATVVFPPVEVTIQTTGGAPITLPQPTGGSPKANRIQAIVPAGTAAGVYDITEKDSYGCSATLTGGLIVTDQLGLTLTSVVPPFGASAESVAITINGGGFVQTPRAFLNPHADCSPGTDSGTCGAITGCSWNGTACINAGPAIQVNSVTFVNANQLTAVVPTGTPAKLYDLVVINPDSAHLVGVLDSAYSSLADPPPVIGALTPQSVVDAGGQTLKISGTSFRGAKVALTCQTIGGTSVTPTSVTNDAETCDMSTPTNCTVVAHIDASNLGTTGTICVVRVTNADGSYADFSALGVTGPSLNLSLPKAGVAMNNARRALSSAAANATAAARYVYAVGGDPGRTRATTPYDSVEWVGVDLFGQMNLAGWTVNRENLPGGRAFHGSAQIGRYMYAMGGTDGAAALKSGARAVVLSPEEAPVITDVDLCLGGGKVPCFMNMALGAGLAAGTYSYRVAALIDPADAENCGGETLASDPIILKLPDRMGRKILVKVLWDPPKDSLGVPLTGIIGYRIYRTPHYIDPTTMTLVEGLPGKDEALLAEVMDPAAISFIDDGSVMTVGPGVPLPTGSTSAWQPLPDMGVARMGLAGTEAQDPADPTKWYVYALSGQSSGTETAGAVINSYEYLGITVQPNKHQTVAAMWTAGSRTLPVGRWELGAWTVNNLVSTSITTSDSWVYVGGGVGTTDTDAGKVAAGGDLGVFTAEPTMNRVAYGAEAAANQLFVFGGISGSISNGALSSVIGAPPTIANFNNEGLQMTINRALLGTSIQSAFIFLVGGETDTNGTATNTTELTVW
ncbi:MAG TPA: IPT/TIG domain-containing protein [Polyangiaceae bacterium]